jgi:hypothetical protein
MAKLSERHEVRVRGHDKSIVFLADSEGSRLVIRQEPDGGKAKEVCSITLSDPDELNGFFKGLRRILQSLHQGEAGEEPVDAVPARLAKPKQDEDEREAIIEQARQRNAQAFAPWTKDEEREIRRRHEAGESLQSIARAHKRSPRAIQLRLQRMGVLPPEE